MTSTTCAAHEYEVGFQLIEEAESRFQVRSVMKRQETGLGKPVVLFSRRCACQWHAAGGIHDGTAHDREVPY